jgi:hypothetical protein
MSLQQSKTQYAVPRFGRMDADLADVQLAIGRSCDFLFLAPAPGGLLERRTRSRFDAGGRLHLSAYATGKRRSGAAPARAYRDDALPERGRQLEHLSRWPGQYLAFGKVLLLGQADGRGLRTIHGWPSAASGFWRTAAWLPATPSPRCISAGWASTTTTRCPPFRRRLSSFPSGSTSISTRFHPGRGRFLCRWPSCTPKSRSREFPPSRESTSCLLADGLTRFCVCAGTAVPSFPGAISLSF